MASPRFSNTQPRQFQPSMVLIRDYKVLGQTERALKLALVNSQLRLINLWVPRSVVELRPQALRLPYWFARKNNLFFQ